MSKDFIKNNLHYMTKALLGLSAAIVIITVAKGSAYVKSSTRIKANIEAAKAQKPNDQETINKLLETGRETAGTLRKKNMFTNPPAKPKPPICYGIIGSSAIINGKQYKVGDKIGAAEVLAVGTKDVTIMWEEKEMKLVPFKQNYRASSGGSKGRPPSGGDKSKEGEKKPTPTTTVVVNEAHRPGMGPGGGRGGMMNMSSEERRAMIERYRNMSPQEREEQRRRFMEGGGFRGGGPRGGRGR
jgi:hypothetical protein